MHVVSYFTMYNVQVGSSIHVQPKLQYVAIEFDGQLHRETKYKQDTSSHCNYSNVDFVATNGLKLTIFEHQAEKQRHMLMK